MTRHRPRVGLAAEDRALWARVARSVQPLAGRHASESRDESQRSAPTEKPSGRSPREAVKAGSPAASVRPQAAIDRRLRRDLAKGRMRIDSRIDLHGLTQAGAHDRLIGHLAAASARGERCVLVITGKGGRRTRQHGKMPPEFRRRSDFDLGGGVLRRMVPLWLDSPPLAELVQAFARAERGHGGDGALYVLLRRRR